MTREVTIEPVLNGFVCRVGCQRVVFASRRELITGLDDYYANPEATEAKFMATAVNKTHVVPPPPTAYGATEAAVPDCVRASQPQAV